MFTRSRPKPLWRKNNWTSNVFRVLELVFGKPTDLIVKEGKKVWVERIKIESAANAWVDKDGNRGENFIAYSLEAKIAFFEQYIRTYITSAIKKLKRFRLPDFNFFDSFKPEYALIGISYIPKTKTRPSGYLFSIALDTSANGRTSAGTVAIAVYTVTGSNIIMLAAVGDQANTGGGYATNVTSVTCNATLQSLTKRQVAKGDPSYGTCVAIWSKLGAASGSILATRTTNADGFQIGVETLSGVDQTVNESSIAMNFIDAGTTSSSTNSPSVTSPTNGWVAMAVYTSTGTASTAGTGTTLRQTSTGGEYSYLFDSNGLVSGSQTLQFTGPSGVNYGVVIVAVGPSGAAATYVPKILQS